MPADGLAFRFDCVEPGEKVSRGASPACIGASRSEAFGGFGPALRPARDESSVGEDRGAEQRVVGLACGLQGAGEGGVGLIRLAEVEELDAAREEERLGQRRS